MAKVTVKTINKVFELTTEKGKNLRRLLLENGISPYTEVTRSKNCGGRGICETCNVLVNNKSTLSCNTTITTHLIVEIMVDKACIKQKESVLKSC